MAEAPPWVQVRRLGAADLAAYKALRDAMLAAHPEAFTSDAATESRKPPAHYLPRLGLDATDGGRFTLGAFEGDALIGAVSLEREPRAKARHVAHLAGMMVRDDRRCRGVGAALLGRCVEDARAAEGLELVTLTVTSTNAAALALYERAGFRRWGRLAGAIRIDGRYHDKDHLVLDLRAHAKP